MKQGAVPFQRIAFVCIHERPPGERVCCKAGESEAIHAALKDAVKRMNLATRIRVSKSGCQHRCEDGPNVMIFPGNLWFSAVTMDDVPAILEALTEGIETPRGDA